MVHIILGAAILIAFLGRNRGRAFLGIAFFVLFSFAAMRYMYGNDYSSYLYHYNSIRTGWDSPFDGEYLYTLMNQTVPSFYLLIAITSLAFVVTVYILVKRNLEPDYAWLGLLIFVISPYLFLMNLSAIRQCMALVFFIAAVHFGIQRKPIRYGLLVIIGALFHKSAYVLLPVYLLLDDRRFKKRYVVLVVAMLFVLLWVVDISEIVTRAAQIFDDANYLYSAKSDMKNSLRATLLTSISFVYVLGNLPKLEGKALVYGKLYLISPVLGILAIRLSALTRIQMYFDIFAVVALPAIFCCVQQQEPIVVDHERKLKTLWDVANKYLLPLLILLVYLLRYYAFFTNPMWKPFWKYQTILELL